MAHYSTVTVPPDPAGATKAQRLGGRYRTYHPDRLLTSSQVPDADTMELVADVTGQIAALSGEVKARHQPALFALLLQSESIASSHIEGYQASPREVAIAQACEQGNAAALTIARNVHVMQEVFQTVVTAPTVTAKHVHLLHRCLLPALHHHSPGYRQVPNWLSGRHITQAQFVPPPPEQVPALMDDLLGYLNSGGENALVKAAIVHAQFETIHPYSDGNGRVGRALTHAVLARAGLVSGPLVPFSAVWRTREREYVAALTAYRYEESVDSAGSRHPARVAAVSQWVSFFCHSSLDAVGISWRLADQTTTVLQRWQQRLSRFRRDSVVHRIADQLVRTPVVSAAMLQQSSGASLAAVHAAIGHLCRAGVLSAVGGRYRRAQLYSAEELLEVVLLAQRGLASADLDTAVSAPVVAAPALPPARQVSRRRCDHLMPRRGQRCTLPLGHLGQHRHRPQAGGE